MHAKVILEILLIATISVIEGDMGTDQWFLRGDECTAVRAVSAVTASRRTSPIKPPVPERRNSPLDGPTSYPWASATLGGHERPLRMDNERIRYLTQTSGDVDW